MHEAKVQMLAHGAQTAVDSRDFDPIEIPTVVVPNVGPLVATDYEPLILLVEQMAEAEAEFQVVDYILVWSANNSPVRATCPRCGNIDNVSDCFLGDNDRKLLVCHDCA